MFELNHYIDPIMIVCLVRMDSDIWEAEYNCM